MREALIPGGFGTRVFRRAGRKEGTLREGSKQDGRRAGDVEPPRAAAFFRSGPHRANVALQVATSSGAGAEAVAASLAGVRKEVAEAAIAAGRAPEAVELVAVSKTKPVALLHAAYDAGQRVFGENYAQELVEKAPQLPSDVRWHFIGPLQSNKARALIASVPNLAAIETVATEKLARKLNALSRELRAEPLDVYVQVDTSGESSKSNGVSADGPDCDALCALVASAEETPALRLAGLMTIGAPGDMRAFDRLAACRARLEAAGIANGLRLSMGMSGDFAAAIAKGSDTVRVGSSIFGARDYAR